MTGTPVKSARNWRDLGPRVASAVVMLVVGVLVILAGHTAFEMLLSVMAIIGCWEFYNMARHKSHTGGGLVIKDFYALGAYFVLFILGLAGLWVLSIMTGPAGLFYIIALVVATDTMGYFVGRSVGGKKFWPSVSPKKTWSGVIGGWVGAALVATVVAVLMQGMHIGVLQGVMVVVFSVLLSFASQLGDIAQSALKRRMGVKDSSNIIPGHGGVLDRFDALLAVGAVLFLLRLIM
jgi:phosphatidate cytidylyltransferase